MRLTLVGARRGRRAIVWSNVLKLAVVIVPLPGIFTALICFLITRNWSTLALLAGFCGGVVIVILVVIGALCTEIRRLPILHDDRPPGS